MGKTIFVGYHATSAHAGRLIEKNGFKIRKDNKHWLGNGIYFFKDNPDFDSYGDAKKWFEKMNKLGKYPNNDDNGCLIRVKLEIKKDDIIDFIPIAVTSAIVYSFFIISLKFISFPLC